MGAVLGVTSPYTRKRNLSTYYYHMETLPEKRTM